MTKYSIIIISKDNRPLLRNCLEKLLPEVSGRAEVVVVEACDTIGGLEFSGVKHVKIPVPEAGFSRQRNAGMANSSGDYVIFIDDDIEVLPGWFGKMTAGVVENPEAVGCMGAVFPIPSGVISFATGVLGHPGGGFRLHSITHGAVIPLPQVATCNTIIKRSAIMAVGGFSNSVNFGGEDTDLSIRLTEEYGDGGFRYLPDALVWHYSKNEFRELVRWYLRRGFSDGELFMLHLPHRWYVVRSAISLKILALLLLSVFAGPWLLLLGFIVWYSVQSYRMRFMLGYFALYDFSAGKRTFVYAVTPLVKLIADVTLDVGRIWKVITICLNA